jgi:hypothetical protein
VIEFFKKKKKKKAWILGLIRTSSLERDVAVLTKKNCLMVVLAQVPDYQVSWEQVLPQWRKEAGGTSKSNQRSLV